MALHKIIRIVLLILAVLGIVFLFTILSGNTSETTLSSYMTVAYVMLGLAILFSLLFSFTELFKNPKALKKTIVSVGAFFAVVLVAYLLSSGEEVVKSGVTVASERASKWVSTGLITFYFLVIIAISSMLYSGLKKSLNK